MEKLKKIYYYSGTHWDREWHKSFQGFRYMLVKITDKIINTLENDPAFTTFIFDGQTIALEDYCEVRPENLKRLSKLIENERIKVGPWYVMPDEFLCSGESLIRNLQIGNALAKEYGAKEAMKYGVVCDIFGHIGQLPQILSGFGIEGALLGRGTNHLDTPAHFRWIAYDGSSSITFKVPEEFGYGTFWRDVWEPFTKGLDKNWNNLVERACKYIQSERKRSSLPFVVIMDSMDHTDIHPLAPKLSKELSAIYDCPVVFESLENLVKDISKLNDELPVKIGELNKTTKRLVEHSMLIPHTLSSRYDIKKENDICQTLMEKWVLPFQLLSSLDSSIQNSCKPISNEYINVAYKKLISNHAHDSICGCSIDAVHKDMHYRFRQVKDIANEIIFDFVSSNIDEYANIPPNIISKVDVSEVSKMGPFGPIKSPDGPIIQLDIWNPLTFFRENEVVVDINFETNYPTIYFEQGSSEKINSFKLYDTLGSEIPYAIKNISKEKYVRVHGDHLKTKRDVYTISFPAKLSSLSKASFFIIPSPYPSRYLSTMTSSDTQVSNNWINLKINDNGTIDIYDKETKKSYNNLLSFLDDGEIGDGWFHVNPINDRIINSNGSPTIIERLTNGPSSVSFRIIKNMQIPESIKDNNGNLSRSENYKTLKISTDLTVTSSSRYVDVKTIVQNNCKDHRLRLVLPTGTNSDEYYVDQSFAKIKRKTGFDENTGSWKEFDKPERSFESMVWRKDKDKNGLLFISKNGLHECAANNDQLSTIKITLFRSFSKTFLSGGEPDGQLQENLEFEYRMMPFSHKSKFADFLRIKDSFQTGLYSYSYPVSKGITNKSNLTDTKPLIELENTNIVVSVIKSPIDKNLNALVVRLFNASDTNITSGIKCSLPFTECLKTDLLENTLQIYKPENRSITLNFRPYEFTTIMFWFK